jgi:hypothetical protein
MKHLAVLVIACLFASGAANNEYASELEVTTGEHAQLYVSARQHDMYSRQETMSNYLHVNSVGQTCRYL